MRVRLKKCTFGPDWEAVARNRPSWRKLVKERVKQFESDRAGRAELKRATRKGLNHPLLADATIFPCEICPRVFLARCGLALHMKWHERQNQPKPTFKDFSLISHDFRKCNCQACTTIQHRMLPTSVLVRGAVHVHDVMTCLCTNCTTSRTMFVPLNKCHICGKICKSKGGLTLHKKIHL